VNEVTPTGTERLVSRIWSEISGRDLRPEDGLFAHGGSSLDAARAVANLRKVLQLQITLTDLFAHPVLRDLAAHIDQLAASGTDHRARVPSEPYHVGPDGRIPMSVGQQSRLDLENHTRRHGLPAATNWVPLVVEILGDIDETALADTLQTLVDRHQSLRAGLSVANGHMFLLDTVRARLEVRDVSRVPPAEREAYLRAQHQRLVRETPDLSTPPLWRAEVLRFADRHRVLFLMLDHLVADGASTDILFDEIATLLRGGRLPEAANRLDYVDWVRWQEVRRTAVRRTNLTEFWRRELAGIGPFPDLAVPPAASDRELPPRRAVDLQLCPDHTARFLDVATGHGATPFMAGLTGFALAWRDATGQADMVVHVASANRVEPEFAEAVGWLAHTVPIRVVLPPGIDIPAAIGHVKRSTLDALAHHDLLLAEIAAEFRDLVPVPRPARLFYALYESDDDARDLPDGLIRRMTFDIDETLFATDMSLYAEMRDGRLRIYCETAPGSAAADFLATLATAVSDTFRAIAVAASCTACR
jgi:hypothetical protein